MSQLPAPGPGPGPIISLFIHVDRENRSALRIPRAKIREYALKPYKWLRFLGYIIFGRHGIGGHISTHHDGWEDGKAMSEEDMNRLELDDNNIIYYFSNARSIMHRLVDYAEGADEATSTPYFNLMQESPPPENAVAAERDGHSCVITDSPQFHCYHLLAYAKGHKLIRFVTRDDKAINDINDYRNIICLHLIFCDPLATLDMAFLQTPNFGLERGDLPPPAPQIEGGYWRDANPGLSSNLTVHYFYEDNRGGHAEMGLCPHNSDIWQPVHNGPGELELDTRWPPQVIFNYVYALGAVKLWGTAEFRAYLKKVNYDLNASIQKSQKKTGRHEV